MRGVVIPQFVCVCVCVCVAENRWDGSVDGACSGGGGEGGVVPCSVGGGCSGGV